MSAHTPGPWKVFNSHPSKACFYIDRADEVDEHAIGQVAVIYTTTDETRQANARLIAAAPDLLASLREVCDLVERASREGRCSVGMLAIDLALDAIAKAEGREP